MRSIAVGCSGAIIMHLATLKKNSETLEVIVDFDRSFELSPMISNKD